LPVEEVFGVSSPNLGGLFADLLGSRFGDGVILVRKLESFA